MPMIAKKIDREKEVSISDRLESLEDKHLLTNDRINEAFDLIKILERKVMRDG